MSTLEKCPFCGSGKVQINFAGLGGSPKQHYAQCEDCTGDGPWGESEEDATAQWNTRSARPEALTLEQRWRDWVNEGDVTEDAVRAGAKVIAASPLIDAPKLSHNEWMGLSRSILEAAFAVSPLARRPEEKS